jgi:putative serine protease PepD
MMRRSRAQHAGRHTVATQPDRKPARRSPSHRAIPVTTQRQRATRFAFEVLRNLGVAVTAAVTALAVVLLVHAVTVNEPAFAASTARARATADLSSYWVERVAAKVLPSVVTLQIGDDDNYVVGSGVILDANGLIMTNYHVVAAASQAPRGSVMRTAVTLNDGRTAEFDSVAADPQIDIAVVRARHLSGLTPISAGSSATLRVGQPVVAVGSPLGLAGTVTEGIISALNRPVCPRVLADHGVVAYEAIQTDAPINPGNSGGALVDLNGRLIGINSAGSTLGNAETAALTPQGSIGLGFAIPVQPAMRIAAELIATGHASHGWLGARVSSDTATRGARIVDVAAGSPAAAAGLTPGALVTEAGDHVIDSGNALIAAVQSRAPGTSIALAFSDTAGNHRAVEVTLGTDEGRD